MKRDSFGLLKVVLVFIVFLIPFCLAEVSTNVTIENSPPVLIKQIPNITCSVNKSLEGVYNLDDYFDDPNTENLNYSYSGGENLSVVIENQSIVSIYPDDNFRGVNQLVFYAEDNSNQAESNTVYVNVGIDEEAPKWSNPSTSKVTVYQNDYVLFSTDWTDNYQLAYYIFSINQDGSWSNYSLTEFSGKENTSEYREQISAPAGSTVYWRFYASDTSNNSNSTSVQQLQIQEEPEPPSGDEPSGEEPSGDVEGDLRDYIDEVLDRKTEEEIRKGYSFEPSFFKISLKEGESVTRVLEIINEGNTNISLTLSVSEVSDFIELSEKNFNLDFGESKRITIDFNAEDVTAGQYFGQINIEGAIEKNIPVVIEVSEYDIAFEANVTISEKFKRVSPGENITANISVSNIKDIKDTTATLVFSIKDFYGKVFDTRKEEIDFSSFYHDTKELTVPSSAEEGEYLFYVKVYNEEGTALDSEVFEVGKWIDVAAFLKTFSTFIVVLILALIAVFLFLLHKREKNKERVLNLYLMVSELRELVNKGKINEAVDLYVRMKAAYGEKVSKEDLDKEKLKENIENLSKKMREEVEKQSGEDSGEDKKKKESSEEKDEDKEDSEKTEEDSDKDESEKKKDNKEESKKEAEEKDEDKEDSEKTEENSDEGESEKKENKEKNEEKKEKKKNKKSKKEGKEEKKSSSKDKKSSEKKSKKKSGSKDKKGSGKTKKKTKNSKKGSGKSGKKSK